MAKKYTYFRFEDNPNPRQIREALNKIKRSKINTMETKAEKLLKKCWTHNAECEECPVITDTDFKNALKEVRQTRKAMICYFVFMILYAITTVLFI